MKQILKKALKEADNLGLTTFVVRKNGKFLGIGRRDRDFRGQPFEFLMKGTQKEIAEALFREIDEILAIREA